MPKNIFGIKVSAKIYEIVIDLSFALKFGSKTCV
jgi:hypothetical protein